MSVKIKKTIKSGCHYLLSIQYNIQEDMSKCSLQQPFLSVTTSPRGILIYPNRKTLDRRVTFSRVVILNDSSIFAIVKEEESVARKFNQISIK